VKKIPYASNQHSGRRSVWQLAGRPGPSFDFFKSLIICRNDKKLYYLKRPLDKLNGSGLFFLNNIFITQKAGAAAPIN
jgi:hypothetical protein